MIKSFVQLFSKINSRRAAVYFLLTILFVLFVTSLPVQSKQPLEPEFYPSLVSESPIQAAAPGDWPQYQHDAARTGHNPTNPSSYQFQEVWSKRFVEDGIASTAQPIVVADRVFIGTEKGLMYALSLDTGTELWQRQLDGGIAHTVAATQQAIFVGTLAGNVYALDIQNGNIIWQFNTIGGFSAAVLLVEEQNVIFMANRFGKVHAISTSTGAELWQTDLGSFILQSPAYGNGRVYIGAEDLKLYALDATDGHIIWTSAQLYGRSFHDYAPVYAEEKVIVNVMPDIYAFSENNFELMKQANMDFSDTNDLADAQDATQQWLNQNPTSQTFYAFDAATGQQPYIPGVLYTVVNSGAQPPPVYANGSLYTAFHVTEPMWLRENGDWVGFVGAFQDHSAMGRLDLSTGRIVERLADTPGEFTTDETNNYAAAGDLLIGARCQSAPRCTPVDGLSSECGIVHTTQYPFTSDLCTPASAPIYANNYILHHAFNVLTAYQAN